MTEMATPVECKDFWYYKNKAISEGSRGTIVYKGTSMGQPIAVKRIVINASYKQFISAVKEMEKADYEFVKKERKDEDVRKQTEVEILRELSHQNIVRIYNFTLNDDFIFIPMEICDKNLQQYCKSSHYKTEIRLDIIRQIGCGLNYLHDREKPIIHRDLRPHNILLKMSNTKSLIV